jgi:putative ABC transport system ATP-binding protein
MDEVLIRCEGLVKIYKAHDLEVFALQGLDLTVRQGELMAIIGNSGSGKSTLLNILGGLDVPSAGRVTVGPWDLLKMTDAQRVRYKREMVGFVWQNNARNLIPYLTALENIELPMVLAGKPDRKRAVALLTAVGLGGRLDHKLQQLSGGEQQRVAIAIALANNPQLLLADEPTGSIDTATADLILEIFRQVKREFGTTIIIVTHDPALARKVDRFVLIRDGKTSAEAVRRIELVETAEGQKEQEVHEELVVLDSAGRLQLPREVMEQLGITDRARLEVEDGKIVIKPPA